jgi:hypothetical protein
MKISGTQVPVAAYCAARRTLMSIKVEQIVAKSAVVVFWAMPDIRTLACRNLWQLVQYKRFKKSDFSLNRLIH